MPIPEIQAQVVENKKLTPDVIEIIFKMINPAQLEFKAGQHFIFEINPRAVRQYSISSSPQMKDGFELCADISPHGPGSDFLEKLKPGDVAKARGPWGRFVISQQDLAKKIFVATGVGITPFKSMIEDLYNRGVKDKEIELYFGVRYPRDIFYFDFFTQLARKWPCLKFYPTLSRPDLMWSGLKGRVTEHLVERTFDLAKTEVYICGSGQMIEDVRKLMLSKGMPDAQIHFEKFFA